MNHRFNNTIKGEFMFLDRVHIMDAERIYKWRSSRSGEFLKHPDDYSLEMQRKWLKAIPEDECYYVIYASDNTEGEVGMIGIMNCNWQDLTASVGALILDEKYLHAHSPYGLEALKLAYGYVFNNMGMRKIHGNIAEKNEKIISLQKFLGMEEEGRLKRHCLIGGEYQDLVLLSLFAEDFPKYEVNIDRLLDKFRK